MVALSLFEVKEGGGHPIYKSEVDITPIYVKHFNLIQIKANVKWDDAL